MPVLRPTPLQVVVVEDDPRYRESLEVLLKHSPGFELAASFGSAVEMLARLEAERSSCKWQIVLMDLELPGLGGIDATRKAKTLATSLLIVVVTVFEEPATILEAICAGADGYLLKRTPPRELLDQLTVVAGGGAPLTSGVARTLLDLVRAPGGPHSVLSSASGGGPALSEREREVLRGLVDGLAYKQVADRLGISIDTVRTHVRGLYKKLQVHSVAEAVGRALRERLI